MSEQANSYERVLDLIKEEEVCKLALDLANIPSPRGSEARVGDFIFDWMSKNGFRPFKQEVSSGRSNVIGRLEGSGGGRRLIFNSHMDTGFGLPEDIWILGDSRIDYGVGIEDGDRLIGIDVVNDKGPMAAFLVAAKAICDSGYKVAGDIILTCVIGEIGQSPVDEFQGADYEGKGFGARYLVTHGVTGDYALVAEGTNFAPAWAEAGDVWFKITVHGQGAIYMPFLQRPYILKDNPNAIVKSAPLVTAIEEWAYSYEQKNRFEYEAGVVVPKANIGAIRAGLPVRPSQTPGVCSLYVDVRLAPGKGPQEVKRELAGVIEKTGVRYTIESYLYRRGYVSKDVDGLVNSVKKAHRIIFNEEPRKVEVPFTSMWRDLNVFNEYGIPGVTYGPPSVSYRGFTGETRLAIKKQDLTNASKVYALTALDICNQARPTEI